MILATLAFMWMLMQQPPIQVNGKLQNFELPVMTLPQPMYLVVPAHKNEKIGPVISCNQNYVCTDGIGDTSTYDCIDKDRILIGPDGNGHWWCLLTQRGYK